jgi:L-alanine-DL-glutamate epimerase-like enolase superfamily enzyme
MPTLSLDVSIEKWPIRGAFTIARGAKTEAVTVVASISDGKVTGRGEATPYARYGETDEKVLNEILGAGQYLESANPRLAINEAMAPGAARNAVDCALWDYEAKKTESSIYGLCGRQPVSATTCYTVSLGTPEEMAAQAGRCAGFPVLKVKLGGDGDAGRLQAVRKAAPKARLIADANEAWTPELYPALIRACIEAGVELIEQPFPSSMDEVLAGLPRPIPVCADESVFTARDLAALQGRYDAVNIKLDKTGGLTEALAMMQAAKALGFKIMIGCMVATSLAMAPAMVLAGDADWVDLDGPLLLQRDREDGLRFDGAVIQPPTPALWG